VGVDGGQQRHALELISALVKQAECPVIADIDAAADAFIEKAARRGMFAYVKRGERPEVENVRHHAEPVCPTGLIHTRTPAPNVSTTLVPSSYYVFKPQGRPARVYNTLADVTAAIRMAAPIPATVSAVTGSR